VVVRLPKSAVYSHLSTATPASIRPPKKRIALLVTARRSVARPPLNFAKQGKALAERFNCDECKFARIAEPKLFTHSH